MKFCKSWPLLKEVVKEKMKCTMRNMEWVCGYICAWRVCPEVPDVHSSGNPSWTREFLQFCLSKLPKYTTKIISRDLVLKNHTTCSFLEFESLIGDTLIVFNTYLGWYTLLPGKINKIPLHMKLKCSVDVCILLWWVVLSVRFNILCGYFRGVCVYFPLFLKCVTLQDCTLNMFFTKLHILTDI